MIAGSREVRPVLAVRHATGVLRRHRGDGAERVALPRLDHHGADGVPRLRAARAQALPLHHVARLRRARPAHHARQVITTNTTHSHLHFALFVYSRGHPL